MYTGSCLGNRTPFDLSSPVSLLSTNAAISASSSLPPERLPHLSLHPRHRPDTPVHHSRVDLTQTRSRIKDLETLLTVRDAACCKDDFGSFGA